MNARISILSPVALTQTKTHQIRRTVDDLRGKVVGFVDNSKPNFSCLADDLAQLLTARHGVAGVIRHRKLSASIPAPDAAIADVTRQCDLVITGSGD